VDLLKAWKQWEMRSPPYVLEADRPHLETAKSRNAITQWSNWPRYLADENFGERGDTNLHLGLIPQPFIGNIKTAKIYILLLNPGLGPHDYFGEFKVRTFKNSLLNNLKQDFSQSDYPFMFLDPQYSWHGGFQRWNGKLAGVIEALAKHQGGSLAGARNQLSRDLASIELLPYHSGSFRDHGGWLNGLPSVQLARDFVRTWVLPKVKTGRAIVVVTRKVSLWGISSQKGVVVYKPQEARSAHLTPNSPGGRAILKAYGVL
jgi:hypothetical protein